MSFSRSSQILSAKIHNQTHLKVCDFDNKVIFLLTKVDAFKYVMYDPRNDPHDILLLVRADVVASTHGKGLTTSRLTVCQNSGIVT